MNEEVINNKDKIQRYWGSFLVLTVLFLFGTWQPIFAIGAFGIMALLAYQGDENYVWMLVFYSMPFANIFKISPDSTSLFTFLLFVFVFRLFLKKQEIPTKILIFAFYMCLIPCLSMDFGNFNILRWVKLISFLLLIYFYFDDERNDMNNFLAYIIGIIASSFVRYMDSSLFRISAYVSTKMMGGSGLSEETRSLARFAGLYGDPNYYSVNLIISLCLVVILYHKKKIKITEFVGFCSILFIFVVRTYSKSSFLLLFLPILMFLYSNNRTRKYGMQFFIICILFIGVSYLFFGGTIDIFKVMTERFQSTGGDINKLTTGRFDLWISYIEYLIMNPRYLLFGKGIGAALLNNKAAHNTYCDLGYHLGIVGTCILISILKQSYQAVRGNMKRNVMNYCILICIITMYFFLSELFYFDAPFHMIIGAAAFNMNMDESQKSQHSQKRW